MFTLKEDAPPPPPAAAGIVGGSTPVAWLEYAKQVTLQHPFCFLRIFLGQQSIKVLNQI